MSLAPKPAPRNFLSNKDILAEIHKSKKSYCYFTKPEFSDYDIILQSVDDIPASLLPTTAVDEQGADVVVPPAALAARAKRLTIAKQDEHLLSYGTKLKTDDAAVEIESIKVTDVIFRITSWDHIPERPASGESTSKKKQQKKAVVSVDEEVADDLITTEYDEEIPLVDSPVATKYVKLNFPPFLHYRILPTGELEVVGKSHWKGDLETGEYCRDHGKPTNKMALMWMKMCERYATRGNWRNYSYNDEMEHQALMQLCNVGLQFDESKSNNPFAYYTAAMQNSFTRVWNIEKKHQDIRDDLMEDAGLNPSFGRQNSESDSD